MIKGSVLQKDISLECVYESKHTRQKLIELQEEICIHIPTIIVRDFNTALSVTERTSRQKISKHINWKALSINWIHLTSLSIHVVHPTTTEYTFFQAKWNVYQERGHSVGHKPHLNKCKRIEVMQRMFSGHNEIELVINNRKMPGKFQITPVDNLCPFKNLYIDIYYSFIHNHPKLETTKMFFNRWMDK